MNVKLRQYILEQLLPHIKDRILITKSNLLRFLINPYRTNVENRVSS